MLSFSLSPWQFFNIFFMSKLERETNSPYTAGKKDLAGGCKKFHPLDLDMVTNYCPFIQLLCHQYKHLFCSHGQYIPICPMFFCFPSHSEFHYLTCLVPYIIWSLLKLFFQRPSSLLWVELCPHQIHNLGPNPQYLPQYMILFRNWVAVDLIS